MTGPRTVIPSPRRTVREADRVTGRGRGTDRSKRDADGSRRRSDRTNRLDRRSVLRSLAGAGVVGVAGCLGGGAGPGAAPDDEGTRGTNANAADDGDDTDADVGKGAEGDGGGDGSDPCDLGGAPTTYDPGTQPFAIVFEYPDTWEEYNRALNERAEDVATAQLGHAEWRSGDSYPVNMVVQHGRNPSGDDEATTNWVTGFGNNERLDWGFGYEGGDIDVYESPVSDDRGRQWYFLLPAHDADGVYGVQMQFQDRRSDHACLDALTGIATETLESMGPYP